MKLSGFLSTAALAMACGSAAFAVPVLWEVNDFHLTDGGAVTGSYVYDADTDMFSDVDLMVSAGTDLGAASFTFSGAYAAASIVDTYVSYPADLTGVRSLYFELDEDMTNAGGSIVVDGWFSGNFGANIVDGICIDDICDEYDPLQPGRGPDFSKSSPFVSGTPIEPPTSVPLPAGAVLMLTALAVLGLSKPKGTART